VTVLTDTPDVALPTICFAEVFVGDGSKNLDGSGGTFELTLKIGGVIVDGAAQSRVIAAGVARLVWLTVPFPVPANNEVIVQVKSPNGADTDVDVTAKLWNGSA